jgi:hypothetical protein
MSQTTANYKLLVMVYAIVPGDLSPHTGDISKHPVYQTMQSIKDANPANIAVVGLIDGTKGKVHRIDLQVDLQSRSQEIAGATGPISGAQLSIIKSFVRDNLQQYAPDEQQTKTLFWWIGHGNGYQPLFDVENDWDILSGAGVAGEVPLMLRRTDKMQKLGDYFRDLPRVLNHILLRDYELQTPSLHIQTLSARYVLTDEEKMRAEEIFNDKSFDPSLVRFVASRLQNKNVLSFLVDNKIDFKRFLDAASSNEDPQQAAVALLGEAAQDTEKLAVMTACVISTRDTARSADGGGTKNADGGGTKNADAPVIIPTDILKNALEQALFDPEKRTLRKFSGFYMSNCMNFSIHLLDTLSSVAAWIAGYPNYNWFLNADRSNSDRRDPNAQTTGPVYTDVFRAINWSSSAYVHDLLKNIMIENQNKLRKSAVFNGHLSKVQGEDFYPILGRIVSSESATRMIGGVISLSNRLSDELGRNRRDWITAAFSRARRFDTPHPVRDNDLSAPDALLDIDSFVRELIAGVGSLGLEDDDNNKKQLLQMLEGLQHFWTLDDFVVASKGSSDETDGKPWDFLDQDRGIGLSIFMPSPISVTDIKSGTLPDEGLKARGLTQEQYEKFRTDKVLDGETLWDWRAIPFFFPNQVSTIKGLEQYQQNFTSTRVAAWAIFLLNYWNSGSPNPLTKPEDIKLITFTSSPIDSAVKESTDN